MESIAKQKLLVRASSSAAKSVKTLFSIAFLWKIAFIPNHCENDFTCSRNGDDFFFFLIGKRREWRRESKWYREKRNIYELKEKKSVWNRIRIRGHPKNFWKNVFRNKKYKGWNKRERTYKKFIILNNTCNQNYEIFIFYILKSIDQKLLFHHSFFLI